MTQVLKTKVTGKPQAPSRFRIVLQRKVRLANKPPHEKIFLHTKFHPIWPTGSKVMAIFRNFRNCKLMAITFEPVVQIG